MLGDLQLQGKGVKKEFIHVRIDVSGSPLECPGRFAFELFGDVVLFVLVSFVV